MSSMIDFLMSGLLVKFPALKLLYAESQIGWIPFFLERADDIWETHRGWSLNRDAVPEPPSTYYYRQVYGCVFRNFFGLRNLADVGEVMRSMLVAVQADAAPAVDLLGIAMPAMPAARASSRQQVAAVGAGRGAGGRGGCGWGPVRRAGGASEAGAGGGARRLGLVAGGQGGSGPGGVAVRPGAMAGTGGARVGGRGAGQGEVRQGGGPAPPRQHETRLEQRQVEAGAIERHQPPRAPEQRPPRGEQRPLLVEVAHEVLRDDERLALAPAGDRAGVQVDQLHEQDEREQPADVGQDVGPEVGAERR